MHPAVRGAAAFLVFLLIACTAHPAFAQYDSLRSVDDISGSRFTWEMAGAFFPHGTEGAMVDEEGEYYAFTRYSHEVQLTFAASWRVDRVLSMGLSMTGSRILIRETRTYYSGDEKLCDAVTRTTLGGYCEVRISPEGLLDPRVRVTHTGQDAVEIAIQLSRILDPTVLACMIGVEGTASSPDRWISATLSAGFVANSRVSLSAVGQWSIPVESAHLPASTVSLHTRYALDYDARRALHFRLSLTTTGEVTWIGCGASIRVSSKREGALDEGGG